MAQVNITINTDNAAFGDNQAEEVARILYDLAEEFNMSDGSIFNNLPSKINLRNYNGNHVGECKIIARSLRKCDKSREEKRRKYFL
jgi:hypothetical protein